jgi:hypothetical protein
VRATTDDSRSNQTKGEVDLPAIPQPRATGVLSEDLSGPPPHSRRLSTGSTRMCSRRGSTIEAKPGAIPRMIRHSMAPQSVDRTARGYGRRNSKHGARLFAGIRNKMSSPSRSGSISPRGWAERRTCWQRPQPYQMFAHKRQAETREGLNSGLRLIPLQMRRPKRPTGPVDL